MALSLSVRLSVRPFVHVTSRCSIERKGKERSVFILRLYCSNYTQTAQAWITQFYLQITPRLPFLRERSLDVATTATAAADIQLQLTTHLSTPKG